jgi:hypothetical protein
MSFHPFIAETMMQMHQAEIEKASRQAWMLTDMRSKKSGLTSFIAMFKRPTYTRNISMSNPCCNCC